MAHDPTSRPVGAGSSSAQQSLMAGSSLVACRKRRRTQLQGEYAPNFIANCCSRVGVQCGRLREWTAPEDWGSGADTGTLGTDGTTKGATSSSGSAVTTGAVTTGAVTTGAATTSAATTGSATSASPLGG